MKKSSLLVCFLCVCVLTGCGPSDIEILKEAESKVQSFTSELNMQNFNSAQEIYPEFRRISRYKVLSNFTITSSKFTSSEKNEVKIFGRYGIGEITNPIQFILGRGDGSNFNILKSKGLSSYYSGPIYRILKTSGCLSDIESDATIHEECENMKPKYEAAVTETIKKIENSIKFEKQGSNLKNNYNIDFSGKIMLKNNSNITIPRSSYEIYISLLDINKNTLHSSKYPYNYDAILANDYHQIQVYTLDYQRGVKTYHAYVKIINDQFIRNYLANSGSLDCSQY